MDKYDQLRTNERNCQYQSKQAENECSGVPPGDVPDVGPLGRSAVLTNDAMRAGVLTYDDAPHAEQVSEATRPLDEAAMVASSELQATLSNS
jgi:hypothetical protein